MTMVPLLSGRADGIRIAGMSLFIGDEEPFKRFTGKRFGVKNVGELVVEHLFVRVRRQREKFCCPVIKSSIHPPFFSLRFLCQADYNSLPVIQCPGALCAACLL